MLDFCHYRTRGFTSNLQLEYWRKSRPNTVPPSILLKPSTGQGSNYNPSWRQLAHCKVTTNNITIVIIVYLSNSVIYTAYHIIHFKPQDKFPHIPSQSWRTAILGELPGSRSASMLNNCRNHTINDRPFLSYI